MQPTKVRQVQFFELLGRFPAKEDLADLRDIGVRRRLQLRIVRAGAGNYGVHRREGDFMELIDHHGPGHKIYMGEAGAILLLFLVVGDKSTQSQDFAEARAYWEHYKAKQRQGGR